MHTEFKMENLDLAIQIVHLIKGQVHIIPPNNPVLGVFGKGVVLPCQLEAKTISGGLFVQWIFTGKSPNIDVTSYDGKNALNPVKEDKTYQGRTHFFQTEINKGNLSLHLRDVRISDKGKYICSVTLENWYDEVVVDLDVAGVQESELVPITVNAECRLLEIHVPGAPDVDNAREPAGLSSPSAVPVLVAKEGFSAGKHYWEVEVGQQQDWVLGVMRQKGKQGEQGTLAGEDFWALHRSRGEIFSIKGNIRLEKTEVNFSVIGVLLDLEESTSTVQSSGVTW
ncbi:UNVERIFIED_CONTAM: hypothetical protein H355_002418 [Colinus virginianus]|nr:hypothetical protein H355_002418 [Colinus virginianus]